MTLKRLFVMTGDASGDIHGSQVIRQFQATHPEVEINAIGGPNIEATGIKMAGTHNKLGILGAGVIAAIPDHVLLGLRLLRHFKAWQPDAVLLIDYGLFNLTMARFIKRLGIRIFYYIPPQIWASRRYRLKTIQKYIDHVFCIFPFEMPLYEDAGVSATFVGHPILEQLAPKPDREAFCAKHDLDPHLPIIGLFPGSRKREITTLMGPMLKALPLIEAQTGQRYQFLMARSAAISDALFHSVFEPLRPQLSGVNFKLLSHANHEILALSEAALAASGTVTLEAALYGTPVVISYKITHFENFIYKSMVYVPYIGMPNLLSEHHPGFLPELMMDRVTPELYAESILPYLSDTPQRRLALGEFDLIRERLGYAPAAENVVNAIMSLF